MQDVVELAKSYSVKIDALRDMTDAFGMLTFDLYRCWDREHLRLTAVFVIK